MIEAHAVRIRALEQQASEKLAMLRQQVAELRAAVSSTGRESSKLAVK